MYTNENHYPCEHGDAKDPGPEPTSEHIRADDKYGYGKFIYWDDQRFPRYFAYGDPQMSVEIFTSAHRSDHSEERFTAWRAVVEFSKVHWNWQQNKRRYEEYLACPETRIKALEAEVQSLRKTVAGLNLAK